MLNKLERNKPYSATKGLREGGLPLNIKWFNIRWYPSNRSCVSRANQKTKTQQMPPLMVRKPDWRR